MKALTALYLATAREFLRDKTAILFTVLLPLIMAGFFGLIFSSGESGYHVTIGVAVEDAAKAELAKTFSAPQLQPVVSVREGGRADLLAALDNEEVPVVTIFTAQGVEIFWDKSRESVAAPALSLVRQTIQEINIQASGVKPLLPIYETPVERRRIPQAQLYVPGMLALGLLWLGVFGVAPPLVQMREQQILRRLGATPLRRATLLGAQVGWRLTTGVLQAVILIGFGMVAYNMVVPAGNWLTLAAAVLLGGAVLISLGFLLASLAKSNESVIGLGQVVQFPMMFLSGILFPLEMLPDFLRPVVNAMPLTYLGDAFRQTMLGSAGLFPLWVDFAVLGGCLVAFAGLSIRFFRWE